MYKMKQVTLASTSLPHHLDLKSSRITLKILNFVNCNLSESHENNIIHLMNTFPALKFINLNGNPNLVAKLKAQKILDRQKNCKIIFSKSEVDEFEKVQTLKQKLLFLLWVISIIFCLFVVGYFFSKFWLSNRNDTSKFKKFKNFLKKPWRRLIEKIKR